MLACLSKLLLIWKTTHLSLIRILWTHVTTSGQNLSKWSLRVVHVSVWIFSGNFRLPPTVQRHVLTWLKCNSKLPIDMSFSCTSAETDATCPSNSCPTGQAPDHKMYLFIYLFISGIKIVFKWERWIFKSNASLSSLVPWASKHTNAINRNVWILWRNKLFMTKQIRPFCNASRWETLICLVTFLMRKWSNSLHTADFQPLLSELLTIKEFDNN